MRTRIPANVELIQSDGVASEVVPEVLALGARVVQRSGCEPDSGVPRVAHLDFRPESDACAQAVAILRDVQEGRRSPRPRKSAGLIDRVVIEDRAVTVQGAGRTAEVIAVPIEIGLPAKSDFARHAHVT